MRHLYREKNGRYYVRIQFPKAASVATRLPQQYTSLIELTGSASSVTNEPRKSLLLSEEIKNYIKFKNPTWIPKTQSECETHLRIFNEMLTDKEVLQLTSKDYDFYIQNLPRWPANCSKNKLYKGKTAREIAMMPDPQKVIGRKPMETHYTTVTGFIGWGADRDENKGMNTSILRMKPQTNQLKAMDMCHRRVRSGSSV